jgi:hypothetical protein
MQNLTKQEIKKLTYILNCTLDIYLDYKKFYKEEIKMVKSIMKKITN